MVLIITIYSYSVASDILSGPQTYTRVGFFLCHEEIFYKSNKHNLFAISDKQTTRVKSDNQVLGIYVTN